MSDKAKSKKMTKPKKSVSGRNKTPVPKQPKQLRAFRHPLILHQIVTHLAHKASRRRNGGTLRLGEEIEICPSRAAPPSGLTADPYAEVADDVAEERKDTVSFIVESARCITMDQYAAKTAPSGRVMRIAWAPPLATITTTGTEPKVDQRGLLVDVLKATVLMKNMTDDTVSIRANCPRALAADTSLVGTRDTNVTADIPPHGTRSITVLFKVTPYFVPFVYSVLDPDKLKQQIMVLLDFVVITQNVAIATEAAYNANRAICSVDVDMRYYASPAIMEGFTSVHRDPFVLQALPTLDELFTVDGKLYADGSLALPHATYIKPTIVTPELTAEKWMRLQLVKREEDFGYSYRLMFCDAKGNPHSKVQLREYQSSDSRLIATWSVNGFLKHYSGTSNPAGKIFGTSALMWDEKYDCWAPSTAREVVQSDIRDPGNNDADNIVPATTPLIAYSVTPPRQLGTFGSGGQLLMLREPDDIMASGIIEDVITALDAASTVIRIFSTVLSIFI